MKINYDNQVKVMKALSDANRLKIVDILSCGEICACDILEHFEFTQPTLSHHMKILMECGLVNCRKEGLWSHYSLNEKQCKTLVQFVTLLTTNKTDCICEEKTIKSRTSCEK